MVIIAGIVPGWQSLQPHSGWCRGTHHWWDWHRLEALIWLPCKCISVVRRVGGRDRLMRSRPSLAFHGCCHENATPLWLTAFRSVPLEPGAMTLPFLVDGNSFEVFLILEYPINAYMLEWLECLLSETPWLKRFHVCIRQLSGIWQRYGIAIW